MTPRRRRADQEGLPDPRARGPRQAARLPRLGRHLAEAAGRARRDGPLLRDDQRQRAPRRLRDRRGGHRRARGRPRQGRPLHRRPRQRARSSSPRTPPRRSTWSPTRGAGPTSAPATPWCSPRWSTTPTSSRGIMLHDERGIELRWHPGRDRRPRSTSPTSTGCSTASSSSASPPCRTCSARSTRSRGSPTPPTPPARIAVRRRLPVRAPPRHRRAGARRRLRRLHRPQDARPHRHRRAVGPRGAARRHAAVPRRRRDDPRRPPRRASPRTSCPGSSRPARRRSPRPSASAPPSTTSSGLGMDAVRDHEVELTAYALRTLTERFGDDLTIHGPSEPAERGGVLSLRLPRPPPPRHLPGARRARRVRAGRPPLRQAADAGARRRRHRPRLALRLQRRGRRRRPGRRPRRRRRVLRSLDPTGRIATRMPGLEDLYREIILDHYRSPRNRGELAAPPATAGRGLQPAVRRRDRRLPRRRRRRRSSDIRIGGQGCSISQSSASMMSAAVKGKTVDEVAGLTRAFKAMMSIHEQSLDGDERRAPTERRPRGEARRPRGAPGRGEVPGPHQVRHPVLEHPRQGLDEPDRRRPTVPVLADAPRLDLDGQLDAPCRSRHRRRAP